MGTRIALGPRPTVAHSHLNDLKMPTANDVDEGTRGYTTSAAAFGATTSLSSLPRHISRLEQSKLALEKGDAEMRARYLPKASPSSKARQVESLDAVLVPHVSTLERRRQAMSLEDGDETMRQRYERRPLSAAPQRRSALQREVEEASAMLGERDDREEVGAQEEKKADDAMAST